MAVGYISHRGEKLSFLVARTMQGAPNTFATVQEEVLSTPGVDGKRWRTVFRQFEPTQLYTVTDCASYNYAMVDKEIAESFKGKLVRLQMDVGGVTYAFRDTHVEGVSAVVLPGPAVGKGATGTSHLVVNWAIILTDFNAGSLGT